MNRNNRENTDEKQDRYQKFYGYLSCFKILDRTSIDFNIYGEKRYRV